MSRASQRTFELSPKRRTLLEVLLQEEGVSASHRPSITRRQAADAVPLSFAQQRLWFLDQLNPGSSVYNLPAAYRLRGPLHTAALEQSLNEIMRRHEALRTTVAAVNGQPVQVVAPHHPRPLPVVDLRAVPEADQEARVMQLAVENAQRPFDLTHRPWVRATLVQLAEESSVFLLNMHHIVSDGWSMGVFFRELMALYGAFAAGKPSPLPELPIQYADFAVWQHQWLQGEVLQTHLSYWQQQLGGGPPVLELPTDRPRPAVQTYRGTRQSLVLSKTLSDSLKGLSQREGVTPFMTLLAAFQILLHRYTGQDDIVVGTPIAGRPRSETEGLIGFFVNTLVLRTELSGNPTVRELLGRVREVALGAYAHQDLPFERLVEELQPARNLAHSPLFQVMFALQNAPDAPLELPGVTVSPLKVESGTAKFDVTLSMREEAGGVRGSLEYNSDLFEDATIARMLGHFQTVLEGIVADPAQRLSDVPLLTEAERQQLLVAWNETTTEYPKDQCLHQLFEAQVERTPDAVAVVFEDEHLTYRELDRRANRLAHHLRTLGVGPECLVGVWMERSGDLLVALLGILKAGGAYAPFDLLTPPERLAFMLNDAKVELLLTHARMLARLPAPGPRTICLDADSGNLWAQPDIRLGGAVGADGLAYVMYTSGSTGAPKGVAVTHRSVVRLVKHTDYARFGPEEVVLQLAALSFDASTFEIWGALLHGGCLAIAPPGVLSVEELGTVLARHGVTTLWLTAGLFHQVVDHRIEILGSLRQLLVGGDVLSPVHVRRVLAALPGCRLINGYGPTEGTTFTCCHTVTHATARGQSVPIGRPIANTRVYVLDRHLHPVPIGIPGELWIAGDGLARGYVDRPELMAERFVVHRLSETLEERLYRSGDRMRWLGDGTLEFLGRLDDQVKVRGYRVELGEIEVTLARHPRVREAAAVARRTADGDRRLVAYVVGNGSVDPRDLREFLGSKLPNYMIPAAFVALDRLPLTTHGKVDRQALPEPEANAGTVDASAEPRDELERQLVQIWQDLLSVGPVGIRDNFFDLGGHSLLAVQMFAQFEEQLRVTLPLATLFQAPTIEGLAALIRGGAQLVSRHSLVPIQPTGSRPPVFAMPGVSGDVLGYNTLARLLGPDQPFYGLQSRGLDGLEDPLTRIEDIAAEFLREIRAVQPEGPYYLVGPCMGGVVAYEMAQQLRAAGQEVGLLGLLETWPPGPASARQLRLRGRVPAVLGFVAHHLRLSLEMLARLRGREQRRYLLRRLKQLTEIIVQRDLLLGARGAFSREVVTRANLRAFQQYAPRVYPGPVVLFCAEGRQVAPTADSRLAWHEFTTAGLEVYSAPGESSGEMLREPHVRVLARQLKTCLERAQASASPGEPSV